VPCISFSKTRLFHLEFAVLTFEVRAGAFEGNFVPGEAQLNLMKYVNIQVKQPSGMKKKSIYC
jgi:hypothetical protein